MPKRTQETKPSSRRQVCVLDARIKGFTAHFKLLEPEDQARFLDRFYAESSKVVEQHGGRLHDLTRAGFLAVFDMASSARSQDLDPVDVHRVVNAAFALNEQFVDYFRSIKKYFYETPVEMIRLRRGGFGVKERTLGLAVGLDMGWAVFASVGSESLRRERILGHVANLARRLVQVAAPREVLTSQSIRDALTDDPDYSLEDITADIQVEAQGLRLNRLADYENRSIYRIVSSATHAVNEERL